MKTYTLINYDIFEIGEELSWRIRIKGAEVQAFYDEFFSGKKLRPL